MKTVDLVKQYLSSEGYKYTEVGEHFIHFKYEGTNLFFEIDNDDQTFFKVVMPNIYDLENNRSTVLEAINTVTRDVKVLKAYLYENSLSLAIEMFLDTTPELDDFFPRCMAILKMGREIIAREIFK